MATSNLRVQVTTKPWAVAWIQNCCSAMETLQSQGKPVDERFVNGCVFVAVVRLGGIKVTQL